MTFEPSNSLDILVLGGSRLRRTIQVIVDWIPDFTGYSARGQVRPDRSASSALQADLTSYLSFNTSTAILTLDVPADVTAAWDFTTSTYDIEIFVAADSTKTVRVLQGNIRLDREVAR